MPLFAGTQAEAKARVDGAFIFLMFGTVWLLLGMNFLHALRWGRVLLLCGAVALLWVLSDRVQARAVRALPAIEVSAAAQERVRRIFRTVNVIQWVSIVTAIAILVLVGHQVYIPTAIGIIVGLHLFPLASAFRYPLHWLTGGLLVLVPGVLALWLGPALMPGWTSIAEGLILFLSCACTLLLLQIATGRAAAA